LLVCLFVCLLILFCCFHFQMTLVCICFFAVFTEFWRNLCVSWSVKAFCILYFSIFICSLYVEMFVRIKK
jgi:hypothetical protein